MFYVENITTAAKTTKLNRQTTRAKFTVGIIHQVEIMFPAGCAGYVHCTIYLGGHQIYPTNPSGDFDGDRETIKFKDYYILKAGESTLTIYTWNLDQKYDHTIRVRIGLLKEDVLAFGTLMSRVPNLVRKVLLGRKKPSEEE